LSSNSSSSSRRTMLPVTLPAAASSDVNDVIAAPLHPGAANCQRWMSTGCCLRGTACQANHPANPALPYNTASRGGVASLACSAQTWWW
jgi:uncharacterized protein (DUF3084 family)